MFSKHILSNMLLSFNKDGLFITLSGREGIKKLSDLRNFLNLDHDHSFLSLFLNNKIKIEEGVDIFDILRALSPFENMVNNISSIVLSDYLDYIQNQDGFEDLNIESLYFLKELSIKNKTKSLKPFHEMVKDFKNYEKNIIPTDYYSFRNNIATKLKYKRKDGQLSYMYTDPLIDVKNYISKPIVLENDGFFYSDILNDSCIGVVGSEQRGEEVGLKHKVKTNTDFVLNDVFIMIKKILYFRSPLTEKETSENAHNFLEKHTEKLSNGEVEFKIQEDFEIPCHRLWREFIENDD